MARALLRADLPDGLHGGRNQVLATRPDLIPLDLIEELRQREGLVGEAVLDFGVVPGDHQRELVLEPVHVSASSV